MKKYNLSKIMSRAWHIFHRMKSCGYSFSKCLHNAWTEAKQEAEKAEQEAVADAQKCISFRDGMEITVGYTTYILSRWQNYGKDRIYINHSTRNIGYLDVKNGNIYGAPKKISPEEIKVHEIVKSLKIA